MVSSVNRDHTSMCMYRHVGLRHIWTHAHVCIDILSAFNEASRARWPSQLTPEREVRGSIPASLMLCPLEKTHLSIGDFKVVTDS